MAPFEYDPKQSAAARERAHATLRLAQRPKKLLAEYGVAETPEMLRRLRQMPVQYRIQYVRALRGRSLRRAVNAFCLECVGWQRSDVVGCTSLGCPLHAVRAGSGKAGKDV